MILKRIINTEDSVIQAAYSDIVFVASDVSAALSNKTDFKYTLRIICAFPNGKFEEADDAIAILKAPIIEKRKAFFRIEDVIQDVCKTDIHGYDAGCDTGDDSYSTYNGQDMRTHNHSIHVIDKYSLNKQNLIHVFVLPGYEYRNTSTSDLTEVFIPAQMKKFFAINAVQQHQNRKDTGTFFFRNYILDGSERQFLSKFEKFDSFENAQKIRSNDYHTLGFLHGGYFRNTVDNLPDSDNVFGSYASFVDKIEIQCFQADGSVGNAFVVDNNNANGGVNVIGLIASNLPDETTNTEQGLLYFGCGTKNLANSGIDINEGGLTTKYYFIRAKYFGFEVSRKYFFEIVDDDCAGYETIRLAFLNSLGAYDYYNFTKKSTRTTSIKRSPFKQRYGSAKDNNDRFYNQGTYEGGTRTYNVNAVQTIECNTDFIDAHDCTFLEELFISPSVFMQVDDDFVPVVILDTEYVTQTDANDKLKQYILTLEKSHETRVQRL